MFGLKLGLYVNTCKTLCQYTVLLGLLAEMQEFTLFKKNSL